MTNESIIKAEKEYIVNVLHKKLIDSNYGENAKTYKWLAKKYWSEEFIDGKRKDIHHINFDHSDNRVCNLVVLTHEEHINLHYMFDPAYVDIHKGKKNSMYGNGYRIEGQKNGRYKRGDLTSGSKNGRYKRGDLTEGDKNGIFRKVWMTNGIDNMPVIPPWDQDMLIFGWKYGLTRRKK